jgi:DNA-binding MarR family transcriptional regulator
MFWEALAELYRTRSLVPGFDTRLGAEVVVWLLRSGSRQRPLKDLYRASRYSEPTVRICLMRLVDQGFVNIQRCADDQRQCIAEPTPKFIAAIESYRSIFVRVAAAAAEKAPVADTMPTARRQSPTLTWAP